MADAWDESEGPSPSAVSAGGTGTKGRRASPKLWVVLSASLIAGLAVGVAIGAAGFANQSLNHSSNAYSTTFQGMTAFQGGTATVGAGFSSHTGCTSGPVALGASLSTVYVGVSVATACTSGDFGEYFTILTNTSSQLASPHAVNFTFQSTYGSGPTVSINSIILTTSSSTAAGASQVIFVDFGTTFIPAGGISGFNVLATETQ